MLLPGHGNTMALLCETTVLFCASLSKMLRRRWRTPTITMMLCAHWAIFSTFLNVRHFFLPPGAFSSAIQDAS